MGEYQSSALFDIERKCWRDPKTCNCSKKGDDWVAKPIGLKPPELVWSCKGGSSHGSPGYKKGCQPFSYDQIVWGVKLDSRYVFKGDQVFFNKNGNYQSKLTAYHRERFSNNFMALKHDKMWTSAKFLGIEEDCDKYVTEKLPVAEMTSQLFEKQKTQNGPSKPGVGAGREKASKIKEK